MTDIVELERRITAAMDRIRRGLDRVVVPGAQADDHLAVPGGGDSSWLNARVTQLETQLADEKTVSAQFEERIRVLKEKAEAPASEAQAAHDRTRARLAGMEAETERLREANADLRDLLQKLRSAMEQGLASPEMINRAMQAELEGLRAVRAADAAELDAVIDELKPLIEGAR